MSSIDDNRGKQHMFQHEQGAPSAFATPIESSLASSATSSARDRNTWSFRPHGWPRAFGREEAPAARRNTFPLMASSEPTLSCRETSLRSFGFATELR
ncbi:hypothetical protein MTO96_033253 [Rhipicephalus appendiculatus]